MSYIIVPNLDMMGGDLDHQKVATMDKAVELAKSQIAKDTGKCATIHSTNGDIWVTLKNPTKSNPQNSQRHNECRTVFYGFAF